MYLLGLFSLLGRPRHALPQRAELRRQRRHLPRPRAAQAPVPRLADRHHVIRNLRPYPRKRSRILPDNHRFKSRATRQRDYYL